MTSAKCGTWSRSTLGCRCDECRSAAAAYQSALRKRLRAKEIDGTESWHGSLGGYMNYRCRCGPCVEAGRVYKRAHVAKNRQKINEQARQRYAKDPERHCASTRRWQAANPDKQRAAWNRKRVRRVGAPSVPFTADQLQQRWEYYGNRCYMCGDPAEVTDHVKPLAKGGWDMLGNLRPACNSCNAHKAAQWPYYAFVSPIEVCAI